ncbi:hypothetical protein Q3G72_008059 [Acer saccharum]|nr:hypothetical protein Q3G72_008059 [Acer saccharum]
MQAVANNIASRCILGRKAEDENGPGKFGELSRRLVVLLTAFSFGDVFPCLAWLDVVTGLFGRINATFKAMDSLFDQVIEEHRISQSDDADHDQSADRKDFVHILLQLQKDGKFETDLTQNDIKAILMDMFVGGTDTTSATLEWAMAELVRHPNIMKKAQEEVRSVVKNKAKVDMNDIDEMKYLKCVIKETLRLHAPLPGGAIDNDKLDMTEVNGLTVAKKFPLRLVPTLYSP